MGLCQLIPFCSLPSRSELVPANRRNAVSLPASAANSKTKSRITISDKRSSIANHGGR